MIDMTNFKKSVKWYDENLATLLPQYRGKYVGVCIDKVCGSWDDQDVGFDAMVEAGYTPGEFIVHRCLPLEEDVGFHCHTDNVFRNPVPLGMDVISMGDFKLINDGKTSFSIRTPSEGDAPFVADTQEAAQ